MKIRTTNFSVISLLFILLFLGSCSKEDIPEKVKPIKPELVEISVISLPEKTIYTLGESLSLKGLIVEGINKDNNKEKLDITEANISGFSSEKSSDKLVLTITVDKLTTTFTVKVLPIKVEKGVLTQVEPNVTTLVLPDYVKSIGSKVFKQSKITNITLNEGLTSIGEQAFAWSQVANISFPKTLTLIEAEAFYQCENLKSLDLSQTLLRRIAKGTFFLNENLVTVKLPSSIKEIDSQAFILTSSLKEILLPHGLLKIGNEAFRETGLVNLKLPNSICFMDQRAFFLAKELQTVETFGGVPGEGSDIERYKMESSTFERCPQLVHLEIPKGIQIIGWNTISGSPNLESIVIPVTVREIEFNAFGNAAFKSITVENPIPPKALLLASGAWQAFPYNVQSIKVPRGSIGAYKAAPGWNNYANIITEY